MPRRLHAHTCARVCVALSPPLPPPPSPWATQAVIPVINKLRKEGNFPVIAVTQVLAPPRSHARRSGCTDDQHHVQQHARSCSCRGHRGTHPLTDAPARPCSCVQDFHPKGHMNFASSNVVNGKRTELFSVSSERGRRRLLPVEQTCEPRAARLPSCSGLHALSCCWGALLRVRCAGHERDLQQGEGLLWHQWEAGEQRKLSASVADHPAGQRASSLRPAKQAPSASAQQPAARCLMAQACR